MLFATLALVTHLLVPQDAAAAPAAEGVSAFLSEASAKLYDPVEQGLTSLAFDVPFMLPASPMLGSSEPIRIATFSVAWSKDAGPAVSVDMAEGLDPQVGAMLQSGGMSAEMLEKTIAQQPLMYALNLNLDVAGMTEVFDATLTRGEADTMIEFRPKPTAGNLGVESIVWTFGPNGTLGSKTTKGPGPMGGKSTATETYSWKPAEVGEGLLLERISVVQDMGMIKLTNAVIPEYRVIGELVVLTGYVQHSDGMATMGIPASDVSWTFENLVVNGAPADAVRTADGDGETSEG